MSASSAAPRTRADYSSLDFDVDVAWLYRGKKRGKQRRAGEEGTRGRASSVSNAELSRQGENDQVAVAGSGSTDGSGRAAQSAPSEPAAVPERPTGGIGFLKRSNSVGERPKKSLFGSLFSRRLTVSSGMPLSGPAHGTRAAQSTDAHGATSRPASGGQCAPTGVPIGRTGHGMARYLNEPSSPEVRDAAPIHNGPRLEPGASPVSSLQQLSGVQLRRVAFAVDKFGMAPPQQIPSRRPRRGNVLIPDDIIGDVPIISQGISNAQGVSGQKDGQITKDSKEYKLAMENYRKAQKESKKHQQEAHLAALRTANEVATYKYKPAHSQRELIPEAAVDDRIKSLEIDKPIHTHETPFEGEDATGSQCSDQPGKELTLDQIYTRCCHLREILPIPSTLKQVKNKTAPLHTLKFLNPRPTLIDLLSFCDFLAVVPIHNVVFDNVNLTPEMFKVMVSSLVNSTALERLSIRNVVLDSECWLALCKFIFSNKSLIKLDISQTKIKQDLSPALYRSNMNWPLFIEVLQRRKHTPLEELLLNGVQFVDLSIFNGLLHAFTLRPASKKRLGVAHSHLTEEHIKLLFDWASTYKVQGIDLAFNNLSEIVKPMVSKLTSMNFDQLHYFTLNSTSLAFCDTALCLRALSKLPTLYFLDLSSLPTIFPEIFPYLNKYLPRFPNLKRLHLDSNDFSMDHISLLSQILQKCKELLHLSLLYQPESSYGMSACAALYDFVANSPKLKNVDVDYEYMPEEISSRIAVCLIRNAQKSLNEDFELDELTSQDDLLFDGELITKTAGGILSKLGSSSEKSNDDSSRRYLLKKYWQKINRVHTNVQNTIDDMFEKRSEAKLTLQGKENLLRLLFVENTLSKILEILSNSQEVASILDTPEGISTSNLKAVDSSTLLMPAGHLEEGYLDGQSMAASTQLDKPHFMATDSGRTIDVTTGRPVVLRQSSQTSVVRKKQEEEEGEFHKWGYFVAQKRSGLPLPQYVSEQSTQSQPSQADATTGMRVIISKIPSGAELKAAIIKAKGIASIEDLIDNVNHNLVHLDNIYGIPYSTRPVSADRASIDSQNRSVSTGSEEPVSPLPSEGGGEFEEHVAETYDKLLNNLSRVRSNR
ncbi:AaceriACR113Wp [[Ashbya] aceris (nom. inval.)]|nr:AaceriACR113Wp [[Ashbya] aceris (nom. inval.)]